MNTIPSADTTPYPFPGDVWTTAGASVAPSSRKHPGSPRSFVVKLDRYGFPSVERRAFPYSETSALGDGANDLDMIEAAGLGAGYRAKAVLRKATRVHIDHGDLTALLYLQGYRREEFRD